jgi:hypothetical protein
MPRRRGKLAKTARLAAIGGALAAAAGALVSQRNRLRGLFGSSETVAAPGPAPSPGPSNYDAPGPPANTATPVPVPEPYEPPTVDEAAEESAAAAEAANIGGEVSDYAAPEGTTADEARPLMEAGQGEAEGQEQAEAELAEATEPTAPGASPEQHQIEDAIEAADSPATGEQVEPAAPTEERGEAGGEPSGETGPKEDEGAEWRTWSGRSIDQ